MFLNNSRQSGKNGFTVRIKDLEVYALHGVNQFEQEMGQIFLLDITMQTPEPAFPINSYSNSCSADNSVDPSSADSSADPGSADNSADPGSADCSGNNSGTGSSYDPFRCGIEDAIENTVNYSYVCRHVTKWMKDNTCQLIETVADSLCREILDNFKAVDSVSVEIKKPHAPIKGAHFDYVSVKKEMAWHDAYLSLGSNSSDQVQKMEQAMEKIKNIPGVRMISYSKTGSYPAVGKGYDGIFLNNAVHIKTYLSPDILHAIFRSTEMALGHRRETEAGTRPIDIDILLYDDLITSGLDYILPYPDLQNRVYVLEPMCEIAPNLRHPLLCETMTELLKKAQAAL